MNRKCFVARKQVILPRLCERFRARLRDWSNAMSRVPKIPMLPSEVLACVARCKASNKVFIDVYEGAGGGQSYPIDEIAKSRHCTWRHMTLPALLPDRRPICGTYRLLRA